MAKAYRYEKRNLRDLGGWATPTGTVKTGILFRSAHLDGLSRGEVSKIRKLGIGYAVDLRHEVEKAAAAERLQARVPGVIGYDLSLSDAIDEKMLPEIADGLRKMKRAAEARAWMCEQYVNTVNRRRDEILTVLEFIMKCDRPTVFYCVAGKDRTGIIAALLLALLGASRRDILRDYERTNKHLWGIPFLRLKDRSAKQQYKLDGVRKCVIDALADACPAYLAAVFDAIDRCGGLSSFLDGLDAALVCDFRKRLIV